MSAWLIMARPCLLPALLRHVGQGAVDRLGKFLEVDRLGQVAVEAHRHAALDVARHGVGRQGDDGDVRRARVGAQQLQGVGAVNVRQVDIHQDQLRQMAARHLHAQAAIPGRQQLQLGAVAHDLLDQGQVGGIVFHVQQGDGGAVVEQGAGQVGRGRPGDTGSGTLAAARSSIQKVLPTPASLLTPMWPSISSTRRLGRPGRCRCPSVPPSGPRRLKGWNSSATCSPSRPMPVSRTLMRTRPPGCGAQRCALRHARGCT
jgi:hypothetical protein